jgi:hypothetical protein
MAVDERRRSQLYQQLADTLGHDEAATMFDLLPPVGADVATSADVARLERRLDAFEQRVDDRFAAFEQRIDERFAASDGRFAAFEQRIEGKLDAQRHELVAIFRGELADTVARQTRAVTVASVSTALSVTAAAVALSQLL